MRVRTFQPSRRTRGHALGFAFALLAGCGGGRSPGVVEKGEEAEPGVPARPSYGGGESTPAARIPCPEAPCAERPVIFVHGFSGRHEEFFPMLEALTNEDMRFDSFHAVGNADHAAWKPNSIGRKSWLFAFDYYLRHGSDTGGSYTAGAGRIGTNDSIACSAPVGKGMLLSSDSAYDRGYDHEYGRDLAELVESVLRATGAREVDIVAHSMGGLVTRSYLTFFGGTAQTNTAVFLASPHRGLGVARLGEFFGKIIVAVGATPAWVPEHEFVELTKGNGRFARCGDPSDARKGYGEKIQEIELSGPWSTTYFTVSGTKDDITYDDANHPLQKEHLVVQDADHAAMLTRPEIRSFIRDRVGGVAP